MLPSLENPPCPLPVIALQHLQYPFLNLKTNIVEKLSFLEAQTNLG